MDHRPGQLDEWHAGARPRSLAILMTASCSLWTSSPNLVWRKFTPVYLKKGTMHSIVTSGAGIWGPNMRTLPQQRGICSITVHLSARPNIWSLAVSGSSSARSLSSSVISFVIFFFRSESFGNSSAKPYHPLSVSGSSLESSNICFLSIIVRLSFFELIFEFLAALFFNFLFTVSDDLKDCLK